MWKAEEKNAKKKDDGSFLTRKGCDSFAGPYE